MEKVKALNEISKSDKLKSDKLTDDELEDFNPNDDDEKKEEEVEGDEDSNNSDDDYDILSMEKRKESLKNGDYVIQVHIIEGRDLKGRGWNAMSDPVVTVEVMEESQSTEIFANCINAVWDQVLFFEFKNLDKQQINEGKCKISVFDANSIMRNVLIGSYEFDLATIYFNNQYHEIYKQWIGLFDVTDEYEGIQGYLRVSIVVLGPNDEQKTHKLVDEDENETNLLSVLLPPSIEQIPYLLSISIYECKNLCTSDIGFFSDACDPFAIVEFGSIRIKSAIKKGINVDMLCELQIPVMEPIMSQSIKISFYDWNATKRNDRIASLLFDYNQIKGNNEIYNIPKWYILYGAPLGYQRGIARKMNKGFIEGSSYRGQCLLSLKITKQKIRPKKGLVNIGISNDLKPKTCSYIIKCDLYEGSEIHKIKSFGINTQKMYIAISIGRHIAKSKKVNVKDGRCEWFEEIASSSNPNHDNINNDKTTELTEIVPLLLKEKDEDENNKNNKNRNIGPFTMPIDIEQCPDIFIYLCCSSNNKRISYLRISFKDIYNKRWANPPKWYNLREDKAINALDENIFPGSVLLALNAGRADDMPLNGYLAESRPFIDGQLNKTEIEKIQRHRSDNDNDNNNNEEKEELSSIGNLTVYIQQGQNLPIMDKNGKSDPYVKLKISDKTGNILTAKTCIIQESLNPKWYQSFTFNNIPIGETLKIKIYDFDKLRSDDLMGFVEILLITQSNRAPGINFDVKNWFFINDKYPDSKIQCRLKFDFLSTRQCKKLFSEKSTNLFRKFNMKTSGLPLCSGFGQPTKKSMQLRIHLYQARNLLATDSNGLCDPYVIIRCCGQNTTSKIINNNIDPQWYETLILNILLPQPLSLSPDIHIQIFDFDKFSLKDDIVGRFIIKPNHIKQNLHIEPNWYKLYNGDGEIVRGEILMSFQLIRVSHNIIPIIPNLIPKTNEKWLQIITLGLRDLNSIFGINKPYLKFNINNKTFKTKKSNKPSSKNPNFLQILKIKIALPINHIFAPSLRLTVKDSLFGGVIRRTIGNASISLQDLLENKEKFKIKNNDNEKTKKDAFSSLSWSKKQIEEEQEDEEEEEKEEKEEQEKDEEKEEILPKTLEKLKINTRNIGANTDIVIDVNTEDEIDEIIHDDNNDNDEIEMEQERINKVNKTSNDDNESEADSTSPLITDLNEVEEEENKEEEEKDEEEEEESFDFESEQKVDMTEDTPDYMIGRKIIDNELEDEITMKPFLEIPIFTGQINSKINRYRKIGYFKGLMEITENKKSSELKKKFNIQQLLQPKHLFIRLYILRGIRLTPKDNDGTCDPYLIISFGKKYKISTRNRAIKNTLNPDFYESFEIPCCIPGTSLLSISVWDWDGIGDDLVGSTTIDIEDRWFSNSWHKIGNIKPLEIRTLHSKCSSFAQGKLELWLEILTDIEIKKYSMLDIKPPPPEPHELRVIIWECKDVTIKDEVTQMNDLYVTGYLDGSSSSNSKNKNKNKNKQQTDLHFRSQKGYGSFNWRMKFSVNLPCKKPPRFRLQIWDKDYFSINDSICEAYLSLSGLFKLCLKKHDRVIMKYRGKERFWINNLKHPNFDGNQGRIKISIECMPETIAQQLPAGYGRNEPNMNPFLPEPEGRAKFSILSPFRSLRNLLGDKMYYKLCLGFVISAVTSFLVLIGPTLASTLMAKAMTGVSGN